MWVWGGFQILLLWIFTLQMFDPTRLFTSALIYTNDQPIPYAPAGVNSDGEVRAPVLMELRRDLVPANGPDGLYGICARVYRVLHHTQLSPAEECRRHYNSRQAGLGDMSEFYHTLVGSGLFNQSLEFPLADLFGRFAFRASFVYLSSKGNEPAVMIETSAKNNHVLCVQSVKCPPASTTTTTATTSTTTTANTNQGTTSPSMSVLAESSDPSRNVDSLLGAVAAAEQQTDAFWDALLSGTEIRSWFLATVSLAILSLVLLIILLVTWIYLCRLRRLYTRRRCHGACRFGCRCPPEVVRQTLNSTGVFGPLDPSNAQQLFHTTITPHANGSIRSGSGTTQLLSGGTMTGSRWGSNGGGGQKFGSPLYVSLANAQGKATLVAHPQQGIETINGSWHMNAADQHASSQLHRRRMSQDPICRSTSEGSSVSGHPITNGGSKSRSGLVSGFVGGASGSMNPSSIILGNTVPNGDPSTSVYYQANVTNYPYSDGGTSEGFSPVTPHSPSQLLDTSNPNELGYFGSARGVPVGRGNGPLNTTTSRPAFYSAISNVDNMLPAPSSDHAETFNSYGSDSLHPTHSYPIRGSDGDLILNITPPSGFYDLNGSATDSALVNGSLTSSNVPAPSNVTTTTTTTAAAAASTGIGFVNHSYLAPLYPLGGTAADWRKLTRTHIGSTRPQDEMVGVVDVDTGHEKSQTATIRPMNNQITFKPAGRDNVSTTGMERFSPKQRLLPATRTYADVERML